MGRRRESREFALKFLYQIDMAGSSNLDKQLEDFWGMQGPSAACEVKKFSCRIINKVISQKEEIDRLISDYAANWDISRISIVDRNVLRAAISELLFMDDIPPVVSINEAVDVAKKYGTSESGKFVNGILDKIRVDALHKKR